MALITHHSSRIVPFGALLAIAAVVLLLALAGGSSSQGNAGVAHSSDPAVRTDGGPEETAVAASADSGRSEPAVRSDGGPEESAVAGAVR